MSCSVKKRWTLSGALIGIGTTLALVIGLGVFAGAGAAASAASPQNTSPPTIAGTAQEGQKLTGDKGTWSGSPSDYNYFWMRCNRGGNACSSISSAGGTTYTLSSADVGNTVRFRVGAANSDGRTFASSEQTDVIAAKPAPPNNTALPTVSGTPQAGEELAASQGTWTGGALTFAYQWQRCDAVALTCVDILGATGQTYGVRTLDVGSRLRVVVKASNASSSATAASNPTSVVKPVTPPPPPTKNKAPTITLISAKFVGARLYIRVKICDDSYKNVTIIARDTKAGVLAYTHRYATTTAPKPCGTYARNWVPPARFKPGRYVVTVRAVDKSGASSRTVSKTFFR